VGNPEEKRPLGRQRRRWVNNIKIDLKEIGWVGKVWVDLAQDKDQWRALCEHGNEPSDSVKYWDILE
jgi:hypothetical protein